jgi:hypothetical protein
VRSKTPCEKGAHSPTCKFRSDDDFSRCVTYTKARARVRVRTWSGEDKELEAFANSSSLAEARVKQKAEEFVGGKLFAGKRHLIPDFVERYITRHEKNGEILPHTATLYRTVLANRIIPQTKNLDAATLDVPGAIRLLEIIRDGNPNDPEDGAHFGEYSMASYLLKSGFTIVQREGLNPYNVIEQALPSVKLPRAWRQQQSQRSARPATLDEVRLLTKYFEKRTRSSPLGDLITVMVGTGLRISEVLALQVEDLQQTPDSWELAVRNHIVESVGVIPGTKSHPEAFRIKDLFPSVVSALQSRMVLDGAVSPNDLIFSAAEDGSATGKRVCLRPTNVRTAL